ncbi:DUF4167 domain-containing protein [Hephaestia mangrovi]|uniref:DUF4167 domain-containing protein n=1 Tax=Hephaestia mangrovi TaxID=2873268 RepID=UPI003F6EE0D2
MNNRQAGRRRGRGGGGQRSQGNPNSNSRIDNRQRGNANQLYEKYKNLARDAQMAGDRVNTEYYLQFADHYFRVLNENKSRFEENRRQREEADADDETDGEDDGDYRQQSQHRAQRRDRDEPRANGRGNGHADNGDDGEEAPREHRAERNGKSAERNGKSETAEVEGERATEGEPVAEVAAPRRRGRPRKTPAPAEQAGLEADRLPPSLGATANDDESEEKPRRRRGRPPASEAAGTVG